MTQNGSRVGLVDALLEAARSRPGAAAMGQGNVAMSFETLAHGARTGAAWLHSCGVEAGDTVALVLAPDRTLPFRELRLFYALMWLGAPVLPLYPHVPPARAAAVIAHYRARWLLDPAHACEPAVGAGVGRLDHDRFNWRDAHWADARPARGDGDDVPALYHFSSGSTGAPKAVLFTAGQLGALSRASARALGWQAGDRLLPPVPWPEKVGLRYVTRAHSVGATIVNRAFPETREALSAYVTELGVSAAGCSPWQLRRLLAGPPSRRADAPALRDLKILGASVSAHELCRARAELTPGARVAYGASEIGLIACTGPEDAPDAPMHLIDGVQAEVVDEDGRPVPEGARGELRLRAPWLPAGYVRNPEASRARFREGWFYPGDLARLSAPGRVVLLGRSDDVINVGGVMVIPGDLEAVLAAHPEVVDAAVVGGDDAMSGQRVVAYLVCRRALGLDEVRAHCVRELGPVLDRVTLRFLRELPRTAHGKTDRERLRRHASRLAASTAEGAPGAGPAAGEL